MSSKAKKIISVIIIMIITTPLISQTNNANIQYVNLFSTKGNVFYKGVPNNLEAHIIGIEKSSIKIEVSDGIVEKQNYDYLFTCEKSGTVTFKVYEFDNLIYNKQMRVKEIPKPEFYLLKSKSFILNKNEIDSIHELNAIITDFDYFVVPIIDSFEVIIIRSGIEIIRVNNLSNKFSPELKYKLKTIEENDLILFQNIKYTLKYYPGKIQEKVVGEGLEENLLYLIKK